MSNQNQSNEHTCENMCFACKIKPGIPTCQHNSHEFAKTDTLAIPVQISGDTNDLKTDKLYNMIKKGEVSLHL